MSAIVTGRLKQMIGPRWTSRARCLIRGKGLPRWGNLRRTAPFSASFGFDRGTPVDRYYLHRFLEAHRASITGDVLEIQSPGYTERYGHDVRRAHTVDIDPRFGPTHLVDLARSRGVIPDAAYDCVLLPNTLSLLRDVENCLAQALRIVKPGGAILATASVFVPLVPDVPDYWRMSVAGWTEVVARVWQDAEVRIEAHGNCLAAVAAMMGLAAEELSGEELDVTDERFPVLITFFARRPGHLP